MPELPEVENFAMNLDALYAGLTLKRVSFHRDDIRFPLDKVALRKLMKTGSRLKCVRRVGKQLQFEFEQGSVYFSLGMSGAFLPTHERKPFKHEHLTMYFQGNVAPLAFVDPRRFGFVSVHPPAGQAACPLHEHELFVALMSIKNKASKRRLRDVLLDQRLIGGLGNIYVCEACFLVKVRPDRTIASLTEGELHGLSSYVPRLLNLAIERGGSSISTYRNFLGNKGAFQELHQVYGRQGQECLGTYENLKCIGTIERKVLGGRGMFFCPVCQR